MPTDPQPADTGTVGHDPSYLAAQQAVHYPSDHGFLVQHATLIGTDLRLVESVLGRLTVARAAQPGTRSGAWLGLLIGALLALVIPGTGWPLLLLLSVLAGTVWGAAVAAVPTRPTSGTATSPPAGHLATTGYDVTVTTAHEQHARRLPLQHTWRTP